MVRKHWITSLSLAATLLTSQAAWATYSIVASDRASGQVGGAAASCIAGASVSRVYQGVPGVGAVHAQALSNQEGRRRAAQLLAQGQGVDSTLRAITSASFDPLAEQRQYGIVRLDGDAAGFTGRQNGFFADDLQGRTASFTYAIQGNLLTSARVLQQAEQAFQQAACDLAARLMAALEAGAANGEGDARCRPARASDAAFLQVDQPDGSVYVRLDVRGSSDPIAELKRRFARFRATQACPR